MFTENLSGQHALQDSISMRQMGHHGTPAFSSSLAQGGKASNMQILQECIARVTWLGQLGPAASALKIHSMQHMTCSKRAATGIDCETHGDAVEKEMLPGTAPG